MPDNKEANTPKDGRVKINIPNNVHSAIQRLSDDTGFGYEQIVSAIFMSGVSHTIFAKKAKGDGSWGKI